MIVFHRLRPLRLAPVAASLLVLLGACVHDSPTSSRSGQCATELTVSATAGTTPTFTWSPTACKVSVVFVEETESGADRWEVETPTNAIASGVTYGVAPAGAIQSTAPVALASGTKYDVVLYRISALGTLDVVGATTFTP